MIPPLNSIKNMSSKSTYLFPFVEPQMKPNRESQRNKMFAFPVDLLKLLSTSKGIFYIPIEAVFIDTSLYVF